MSKITKLLILGLSLVLHFEVLAATRPNSSTCNDVAQVLNEGDLIYISSHNYVFKQVEKDTLSWTSHTGVAFREDSTWVVYESKVPFSKITPLCDFVARSRDNQVAVTRYSAGLSTAEVSVLKSELTKQLKVRYDLGFDYLDHRTTFCSKFIYDAYKMIGIQVGYLATLGNLFLSNPQANINFWRAWFYGRIPYDRITITPASQLLDAKFFTVYKSF